LGFNIVSPIGRKGCADAPEINLDFIYGIFLVAGNGSIGLVVDVVILLQRPATLIILVENLDFVRTVNSSGTQFAVVEVYSGDCAGTHGQCDFSRIGSASGLYIEELGATAAAGVVLTVNRGNGTCGIGRDSHDIHHGNETEEKCDEPDDMLFHVGSLLLLKYTSE